MFKKTIQLAPVLLLPWATNTEGALHPVNLRCEYRTAPLGIDQPQPRLSWRLEIDEPTRRGQRQTAYRVLVATSPDLLRQDRGDLWDSGKVSSGRSTHVEYEGKPLVSRLRCYWKVHVWDEQGSRSASREPAMWSMGLLKAEDWKAGWIGFDEALEAVPPAKLAKGSKEKVYLPCPCLRKRFTVKKGMSRATIYATALGVFELRINGRRVGQDYFTPGWTDYHKRIYYHTWDVTDLVRPGGDNAITAILSDGWYAGNISNLGQRFYGSRLRLRAQLHLTYNDGTSEIVPTDASWKATYGPIREADMQAGETYDARLEIPTWDTPDFNDRAAQPVAVTDRVDAVLQAYPGVPVQKIQQIRPIGRSEPKPGVYVFDMGQNFAGWVRLVVRGKTGDKVVLRFAEMRDADGTIYTENLRSARATDTYILKGQGQETWQPRFTFHGFRYVEVTGYPGEPPSDAITGIVVHCNARLTGSFECSNAMLNQLYSNILWSQRSNYLEVPTDCPQRDERMGWMGDAQVFVRTATYNMDVAAFFTKWLVDVDDAQYPNGAFPAMAPRPHDMVSPGWGDAGVICPWTIYEVYGDTQILRRHYRAMARWIDYLESRSEGSLSKHDGFGDWLNVNDETPKHLIATAYFAHSTDLMANIARVLGKADDAKRYEQLLSSIRRAFAATYVRPNGEMHGNTQTAYLMALRFGLLPRQSVPPAADQLLRRLKERDWHLSSGFLGVQMLLPTLTQIGRSDVAYRLLQNDTYPSWGYSIANGATTLWERWNSYTEQDGFGDARMNSFNHYAFGSVGQWMFSTLAGIDTDGPGFKRLAIHPRPGGGLTYAKASYQSIHGTIATHWRLRNGRLELDVTVPVNTTATVYVPARGLETVTESGRQADRASGVVFDRMTPECAVFKVGSGRYRFAVVAGE